VFWMWNENNVDNVLMFSVVMRQSKIFLAGSHWLGLPGAREAGRGHSWDSWPQLAKGIFHTICHAQYTSWGSWPGSSNCCLGTGWVSFIRWWATAFVHHLFCIHIIVTIIIIIISSFALLLNCLYLNLQVFTFSHPPPSPMGWRWGVSCLMV